jgi:succinate dehydrogenase / fumarate reductase, cytochrome b subunit
MPVPHGSAATSPNGVDPQRSRAPLASREGRWSNRLPWLQSLLGVVPVGLFLLVHLWLKTQQLHGSQPPAGTPGSGPGATALVLYAALLGAVALHAVLGLGLWLRPGLEPRPSPYPHGWMRRLERVSGLGVLGLVALHAAGVVLPWMTGRLGGGDVRTALIATLSTTHWGVPLEAMGYLLGLACVAVHLGQGLWAAAVSWRIVAAPRARRWFGAGCAVVAVAAFALAANTTVELATGSALTWPWQSASAPTDEGLPGRCPEAPSASASASAPAAAGASAAAVPSSSTSGAQR